MRARIIYTVACCFLLLSVSAQNKDNKWEGEWRGAIEIPGTKLELSIDLIAADAKYTGTMSIPMQRIANMALADLVVIQDSIFFRLPKVPGGANFSGKRDRATISGIFAQSGQRFPMYLERPSADEAALLGQKIKVIQAMADSFRQKARVAGLGLAVVYRGEVLLTEGFGQRDVSQDKPVTAQTLFAIGSSSKAFTTTGLAILEDEGKLSWDEPVRTYLPDFQLMDPFATQEATSIDLVTHRSGLPRHDLAWYLSDLSREELYQKLQYFPFTHSFRAEWQYQNLMYMTAGILIERISGQSWEEFTKERLLEPLGMHGSLTSITGMSDTPDHSLGYTYKDGAHEQMPYYQKTAIGPAGMISSSATDMAKWLQFQLSDGKVNGQMLVSNSNLVKMHKPHMIMSSPLLGIPGVSNSAYGLGWCTSTYNGINVVEHGGNIDGFSALVLMAPEEELGIALLTNRNGTALPYALGYASLNVLLDREVGDWSVFLKGADASAPTKETRRTPDTRFQHPLKSYAGKYMHPAYGTITIAEQDEQLSLQYYNMDMPLAHWHFESFMGTIEELDMKMLVTFQTNAEGQIISLTAPFEPTMDPLTFTVQTDKEKGRDVHFLEQFVGTYMLNESREIRITLDGTKLQAHIEGQPVYDLDYLRSNEFKLKQLDGFTAEFVLENGKVIALKSHQPNGTFTATRKE